MGTVRCHPSVGGFTTKETKGTKAHKGGEFAPRRVILYLCVTQVTPLFHFIDLFNQERLTP